MVVQFGELDFRTPRTGPPLHRDRAQGARELGVEDPSQHLLVAAHSRRTSGDLSTIVVKRTPFTAGRGRGLHRPRSRSCRRTKRVYAPGGAATAFADHPVSRLAGGDDARGRPRSSPTTHGRHQRDHRRRAVLLALLVVRRRAAPHLRTARRDQPRGRHRRARAAAAARRSPSSTPRLPAAAVLRSCAGSGRRCRPRASRPCTSPRSVSASCSSRSR